METQVIAVNVTPSKRLLARVQKNAKDLSPVLRGPILNRVHAMFKKIWETEGAYIANKWPALAESTLEAKRAINREHMGILRRYNTMWASLTKRSHPLGYAIVEPDQMRVGTNVAHAAPHQTGSKDGRLPQRKFIPDGDEIPQKDRDEWDELIIKHLESGE